MKFLLKLIAICITCYVTFSLYNYFTYDFNTIKGEKDGEAVTSPNGTYSAQIYYQYYGGAAGGVNVFINVISHLENNIEQTVYFSDAKSNLQLNWLEEDVLAIKNFDEYEDRSIELIVGKEIYDESGKACRTYNIKKNYVCHSKNYNELFRMK